MAIADRGGNFQAAVLAAQSWAENLGQNIIVKLDIRNAFNSINRGECLRQLQRFVPELLPWSKWILGGASPVWGGGHEIVCSTGVQQGNPLSPLFFDLGLHPVIEAVSCHGHVNHIWWQDDDLLHGDPINAAIALDLIRMKLWQA